MIDFYNFWHCLEYSLKLKLILIACLFLISAFLELLGVGLIIPILNFLITGEESLVTNQLKIFFQFDSDSNISYFFIFLLIFFFIKNTCLTFINFCAFKNVSIIRHNISIKMYQKYITSKFTFFINNNSNTLVRNLSTLISDFNARVLLPISILLTELFILFLFAIFAFYYEFIGSLILFLLLGTFCWLLFNFVKRKNQDYGVVAQAANMKRIKNVNEMIMGIKEIKLFDLKNFFINQYNNNDFIVAKSDYLNTSIQQSNKYFFEFVLVFSFSLTLYFLHLLQYSEKAILEFLIFFGTLSMRLGPSFSRILTSLQAYKYGQESLKIINNDLLKIQCDKENLDDDISFKSNISLKNVSFKYPFSKYKVLDNLFLKLLKGKIYGIKGACGSGKTTLINIIMGLIHPQNGSIFLDGRKLSKNHNLRKLIGFVPQDVFLIDDSICANVALGVEEKYIDINRVYHSLQMANLMDFINQKKHGINTMIGERGLKLSGGQKQRIAIARALYFNAKFLIFDEATSALDVDTEKDVIDSIVKLKSKYTILIIAHRMSTLKHCDFIYKFNNSKLMLV